MLCIQLNEVSDVDNAAAFSSSFLTRVHHIFPPPGIEVRVSGTSPTAVDDGGQSDQTSELRPIGSWLYFNENVELKESVWASAHWLLFARTYSRIDQRSHRGAAAVPEVASHLFQ